MHKADTFRLSEGPMRADAPADAVLELEAALCFEACGYPQFSGRAFL